MSETQRLAEIIKDIKFTMLTTVCPDGTLKSRPMATQEINPETFDGKLWFFTKNGSEKVHQIEQDQHVNLAYADPSDQKYVSISGKAVLSTDRDLMKSLWKPIYKAWFPEGLDDPTLSLIGVEIESADLWNSPSGKVVQLVGFVKATVTGQPFDGKGMTEHLDFNRGSIH